jgi:hypothetical protein
MRQELGVRQRIRQLTDHATLAAGAAAETMRCTGPGLDPAAQLGAEIIRTARLATALHLAAAARHRADGLIDPAPHERETGP